MITAVEPNKVVKEIPKCDACKTVASADRPVGFAAFCQPSNLLTRTRVQCANKERATGQVISLCGHAMCYKCFDESYFPNTVEQSESMGHLILDVDNGEYPCMYCKAVSNTLVPFIFEGSEAPQLKPPAEGQANSGSAADGVMELARSETGSSLATDMSVSPDRAGRLEAVAAVPAEMQVHVELNEADWGHAGSLAARLKNVLELPDQPMVRIPLPP
jgi:predicted nucleic-acid-binding Zn-ribbon protein